MDNVYQVTIANLQYTNIVSLVLRVVVLGNKVHVLASVIQVVQISGMYLYILITNSLNKKVISLYYWCFTFDTFKKYLIMVTIKFYLEEIEEKGKKIR